MYTGIVQGAYPVIDVIKKTGLHTISIALPAELMRDLTIGASIGVDGVCLTVTQFDEAVVTFDVMQETLDLTTLGDLSVGSLVNIERSAKQGVEIGGHNISGHIDGTATIVRIEQPENNYHITYEVPATLIGYIFRKGFIGLNGCSLTVADVDKSANRFKVSLIPETLRVTNHGEKKVGDAVNVEIDRQTQVIVDTVKQFLMENMGSIDPNTNVQDGS